MPGCCRPGNLSYMGFAGASTASAQLPGVLEVYVSYKYPLLNVSIQGVWRTSSHVHSAAAAASCDQGTPLMSSSAHGCPPAHCWASRTFTWALLKRRPASLCSFLSACSASSLLLVLALPRKCGTCTSDRLSDRQSRAVYKCHACCAGVLIRSHHFGRLCWSMMWSARIVSCLWDLRCKSRSREHLGGLVKLRKEAQTPAADRSLLPRLRSCSHRGHTRLLCRGLQHEACK